MTFENLLLIIEWLCLAYFIALNGGYLFLTILSLAILPRYIQRQTFQKMPHAHTGHEPPISIVVTAYNEEAVIISSVKALFQLNYPQYEIVVVNDGSKDKTLDLLKEYFDLEPFPMAFRQRLKHKPVRGIYQSRKHPNLRVVDKINGGCKADAANAGINATRYGLYMPLDADTILERECLNLLVQPYLFDPKMVAVGGNVRIANGCQFKDGLLVKVGLSRNWFALCQTLEYLRAFLTSRIGWSAINSLPLISGAFGLFHKETVVEIGGYFHQTLGEDMDLILRIHRELRLKGRPYSVTSVADSACWTEVPESLAVLKKQRVRWQRGLFDSLWLNRKLLFHPKSGGVGWLSFPFLLFLEGISPIIEVGGLIFMFACWIFGYWSWSGFLVMMFFAFGTGFVLTIACLLVEEVCFKTYPKIRDVLLLFVVAFLENFGYRQLQSFWRLEGTWKWIKKDEFKWGDMTRVASWAQTSATVQPSKTPPPAA